VRVLEEIALDGVQEHLAHARRFDGLPPIGAFRITPPRWGAVDLNLNLRPNRHEKADRVAYWRDLGMIGARGIPAVELLRVEVLVRPLTSGRFDQVNYSLTVKSIVDGIVDAKVIADDDSDHVLAYPLAWTTGPRGSVLVILSGR